MTPNPAFKGTQLFDVGFLRNDTGWTHGNYRPLKPGTVHTGNKVDSSRSTLLKVNKVDRVEFNFVPAVSIPGLTESDMWPIELCLQRHFQRFCLTISVCVLFRSRRYWRMTLPMTLSDLWRSIHVLKRFHCLYLKITAFWTNSITMVRRREQWRI